MPDDRMQELFEQVMQMAVDVPPTEQVIARGRRRRRARLQASTIAWTVALAVGFGGPQAAGSLAGGKVSPVDGTMGTVTFASKSPAAPSATPTPAPGSMGTHSSPASSPAAPHSHGPVVTPTSSAGVTYSQARPGVGAFGIMPAVPPPGAGPLLLGLDVADHFVMARMGSAGAPVPLPGLTAFAAAPVVLVTNPAGGWLVTVSANTGRGSRPARLALVATTGQSEPFGPRFARQSVASAAVSPDGSRVAVALTRLAGPVQLEILPLPGHGGATRSWRVPVAEANLVTALSWAPDGRHLTYLAGRQTWAGITGDPVTLDTASRKSTAPAASAWPAAAATGAACVPDAAAWLGSGGRFAALEQCRSSGTEVLQTANARTGAPVGRPIVVAKRAGCGQPTLDPDPKGSRVLISYCGIYLAEHGKLTKAPAGLTAAAISG